MFSFRGDQDWSPFPNGESERSVLPFDPSPLLKWGLIILGLIFLFILLSVLRQIYTNWLWFDALDYRSVYVKILATKVALFFAGAAFLVLAEDFSAVLRAGADFAVAIVVVTVPL